MSHESNSVLDYKLIAVRPQSFLESSPFHQWILPDGALWAAFYRTDSGYLIRFPELADYEISENAYSVNCYPVSGVTEETTQHLYLNQVLPLALSMRGKLVFHGSAVEVDDAAVAFVAESGRGKSTLAASFACNGFRFLTDDGLVVEPCGSGFQVLPSHPSIRLWADSKKALMAPGALLAPPLPFTSKSRFLAGPDIAFCNTPLSLRRVYFLGNDNSADIVISPLKGAESMVEWVKHSFLLDIEEKSLLVSHFDFVAKLVNHQIHYRLDYPRHFEELVNVRKTIIKHINEENTSY